MGNHDADLSAAFGHTIADKRLDILRRVGETGSISEAARAAGVSYKAAWQALDTLSNLAGTPLVTTAIGGSGGGGAALTDAGRRMLYVAAQLAIARREILARIDGEHPGDAAVPAAEALALRTSMRNQLPCRVRAVRASGGFMRVELSLPDGATLRSRITRESAQLLALRRGVTVLALFKATAVPVSARDAAPSGSATACRLEGSVARVARGTRDSEVALRLASGQQVVGFAARGHGLRPGASAVASVDEASVVIAVSG